jgi:hypothetical protein
MIWWGGHGGSAAVIGALLVMFVIRALSGRRGPAGRGQRTGSGFLAPPRRGPDPDPGSGSLVDRGESTHRPGFTGIPAGWLPDPTGRFERRYWSGREWTEHVTSGGVPGSDAPPGGAQGSDGH